MDKNGFVSVLIEILEYIIQPTLFFHSDWDHQVHNLLASQHVIHSYLHALSLAFGLSITMTLSQFYINKIFNIFFFVIHLFTSLLVYTFVNYINTIRLRVTQYSFFHPVLQNIRTATTIIHISNAYIYSIESIIQHINQSGLKSVLLHQVSHLLGTSSLQAIKYIKPNLLSCWPISLCSFFELASNGEYRTTLVPLINSWFCRLTSENSHRNTMKSIWMLLQFIHVSLLYLSQLSSTTTGVFMIGQWFSPATSIHRVMVAARKPSAIGGTPDGRRSRRKTKRSKTTSPIPAQTNKFIPQDDNKSADSTTSTPELTLASSIPNKEELCNSGRMTSKVATTQRLLSSKQIGSFAVDSFLGTESPTHMILDDTTVVDSPIVSGSGLESQDLHGDEEFFDPLSAFERDDFMRNLTLDQCLGNGSFGTVYRATGKNKQVYALKVMKKDKKGSITIDLEVRALQHAKGLSDWIVQLEYYQFTKDYALLGLTYYPGGTLLDYLEACGGSVEPHIAVFYTAQLILAVQSIHKVGIIHHDVKLDNVVFDANRNIKLIDFGLAVTFDHAQVSTKEYPEFAVMRKMGGDLFPLLWATTHNPHQVNDVFGTEGYTAPEIWKGLAHSYGVDYWGVACIYHWLITGTAPYEYDPETEDFDKEKVYIYQLEFGMTPDEYSFLNGMLNERPHRRFNVRQMKEHPLFASIDWQALSNGQLAFPTPEY